MSVKIVHVEPTVEGGHTTFVFEAEETWGLGDMHKVIKDFKAGLWDKEELKPAE